MDKKIENARVEIENLAVPEVRFEEETSDVKKEVTVKKMHIDYSGAIPQVTYTEE